MPCFFFCHTLFLIFSLLPSFTPALPPLPPRPVESDNTLRIKNEKTRSLLLFTNVTEKHFGNYTCFASNRLGASNASMLLFRKLSHGATCVCIHTVCIYANPGFHRYKNTLTFILCDYQSTRKSLNRHTFETHKTIQMQ